MQDCMMRKLPDRRNLENELGVSKIPLNSLKENTPMQDCMRKDQPDGCNKKDKPVDSNILLKSLKAEPFANIAKASH